jgi:hypothetical protein
MSVHLLYLNTHRLTAYAWQKGRLVSEGVFGADDEGLQRYSDYLASRRKSCFHLLANVSEEGHVVETIPFLKGSDRQALITRKLGQHFLGTPLASAVSLGFEKTERKNEKLLLSALTNPAHFEPWLQRLNAAEVALAGVYTVAQLGGRLLDKLGFGKGRCLLLTLQDHSLRESYMIDGQAHFSRMAPLNDSSIAGMARSLAAEAGKLHQYLIGQRLIGRDEELPVFILAHPQAMAAIEQACPDQGHLHFKLIDNHTAGQQLHLQTLPEDSRSEALFLHLLAIAAPRQQVANEELRHNYRLAQIRRALFGTSLVLLLGGLLFAAKEAYRSYSLHEEAQALAASEADMSWRYREIAATFPQLGIDNETLRRLTDRHAEYRQQQRQPGSAYRVVSLALNQIPSIDLESIEWQLGTGTAPNAPIAKSSDEVTIIRGSIRPEPNAGTRQILSILDQFVQLLRADPANTVNVIQQPFDIESGRNLRGGDGDNEMNKPHPFTVQLLRKLGP